MDCMAYYMLIAAELHLVAAPVDKVPASDMADRPLLLDYEHQFLPHYMIIVADMAAFAHN